MYSKLLFNKRHIMKLGKKKKKEPHENTIGLRVLFVKTFIYSHHIHGTDLRKMISTPFKQIGYYNRIPHRYILAVESRVVGLTGNYEI